MAAKAKQKSKYASVSSARAQRVGNYYRPGHYLVVVDAVEEGQNQKKTDFIAIQQTVMKTFEDSHPGFDYARKTNMPPHSVGEGVSDVILVSNIAFDSRMKTFAMVAGNLTEEDFEEEAYEGETIEELVSDEQPVAGAILEVRADQVIKQNAQHKSEEDLNKDDVYVRIGYIRRLTVDEAIAEAGEDVVRRFLPDAESQSEE